MLMLKLPGESPAAMAPVRPQERIVAVDILRGFAVLGILLVNMLSFSGYFHVPTHQLEGVHRLAVLFIKFVAQAKFYTLFSFLFGWGMAIQMARAARRETSFAWLYVRRLAILLLIGLAHAVLVWDGDILVTYAMLGFPLLLFRRCSDRTLLVAATVFILIPVLLSVPGPTAAFCEAYDRAREPLRQLMLEGYRADVLAQGSYLETVVHRLKALRFSYSGFLYSAPHVFGMFLLGLYVGRRRLFHDIPAHFSLFRHVLWWSLIVGLPCNLLFVAATDLPGLIPHSFSALATRGVRTIGGSALCLAYVSAILLLTQRETWRRRLAPLAAVGRTALSNYLLQSMIGTLIFYGYGLGLYRDLGPAITLVLTFVVYRAQVGLSAWWLSRFRYGPAEWLWRSLTYGAIQPLKAEPGGAAAKTRSRRSPQGLIDEQLVNWITFVGRRLLFIAAVAFAIVYFCTLGLQLSVNSTAVGQTASVWRRAGPALEGTLDFFRDLSRGELGYVSPGVSPEAWESTTTLLTQAYVESARLLMLAVGLAAVLGIAAGALAASWRHSPLALPTLTATVIGVSIPSFFLALLLQIASIAFYKRTGVRLVLFGPDLGQRKLLPRVVLPALVLVARPLAHITRVTFVTISDILERDYIRTARAKGLRELLVFWRHMLRNAGVSVLTAVVVSLRFALGSLPVAEIFFNWPGLGVTMLNGVYQRDRNVVAGAALILGLTFLLINLSVDVIYRLIDPRLRAQSNGGGR